MCRYCRALPDHHKNHFLYSNSNTIYSPSSCKGNVSEQSIMNSFKQNVKDQTSKLYYSLIFLGLLWFLFFLLLLCRPKILKRSPSTSSLYLWLCKRSQVTMPKAIEDPKEKLIYFPSISCSEWLLGCDDPFTLVSLHVFFKGTPHNPMFPSKESAENV